LAFSSALAQMGSDSASSAPKAPPASAQKKDAADAKKKEEPPKIDGLTIPRANGTFLGIEIKNNNFVLSFYDAKKKKVAPDLPRATLRWPVKYQPTDERTVLNPGSDGFSLTSPKGIRAPHTFKLYVSLFAEGKDDAAESYVVDYHD